MNLLGKGLKEYISAVKIPVIVMIFVALVGAGWNIISAVMGKVAGPLAIVGGFVGFIVGIGSFLLGIALALHIGYKMAKNAGSLGQCAVAGVIFALLAGLVSWVVSTIAGVVAALIKGGASAEGVGGAVIAVIFAAILGPIGILIIAGIDAVSAVVGGLIGGAGKNKQTPESGG